MVDELTAMHDVVARKEHRCSWCNKRIFKMEAHRSGVFKYDSVYTWRECNRCKEKVSEFIAETDCRDDFYTGEQFAEWLKEEHPVTYWQWALEDAKVALSEIMRSEADYESKAEFEHLRRAAMYEISSRANELERVKRVRAFQLQDTLIREMYDLLERCNNDDVSPSTDEVNAVYEAICKYATRETVSRMEDGDDR